MKHTLSDLERRVFAYLTEHPRLHSRANVAAEFSGERIHDAIDNLCAWGLVDRYSDKRFCTRTYYRVPLMRRAA